MYKLITTGSYRNNLAGYSKKGIEIKIIYEGTYVVYHHFINILERTDAPY